ncbi:unnamed protein product [marine sediment metagenome]|uniref:Uncharacterized protein n=1 Tax=marine sediment metagenome TaxID=412755 RepID=X1N0N2_9ZZZZ
MPEEPDSQQLKKQYPEFFKEFPAKLIDLASSDKTASQISEICLKNGVEDEEIIGKIAYHITSVLLGRLPLEILPKALIVNLKMDAEVAEKISLEASRRILSPVKDDLAKLYPPAKPIVKPEEPKVPPEEKPKKPPRKDIYHEPIE